MKDRLIKTRFVPAIIFLFLCASFFFLTFKVVSNQNEALQQSHADWQTESLRREEIRQLEKLMKGMEKERATLDAHFVEKSDVVIFLNTIENLATAASVEAEISSVDTIKDDTSLSLGIKASGSFESLYKFLMLLENAPYDLEFLFVDMQKLPFVESGTSRWEAIFRVKLLSFIQ